MYRFLVSFCLLLMSASASAALQDIASIRQSVKTFVKTQTANLPGEVTIHLGEIDSRLSLPACQMLEPFLTEGSKLWGNSTVGVKCAGKWTVYVPVKVGVIAPVVISARPLAQGMTIGSADILIRKEDITSAPPGVLMDMQAAIGKTLSVSIPSGYPISASMMRSPTIIRPGQSVKLISRGKGFQVTSSGIALGAASEGQVVQVRTPSGQVVSGTARADSTVDVTF
ncbi:MAG: flagellar basal body P-ring formation chaperone FlgA [Burkholderiales bacterium]